MVHSLSFCLLCCSDSVVTFCAEGCCSEYFYGCSDGGREEVSGAKWRDEGSGAKWQEGYDQLLLSHEHNHKANDK